MQLGLGIGLGFKVNAILQAFTQKYDPLVIFGSDLVTWYGNSVDDLWRAQSSGGPVTLYQDSAGATPVTAIGQSVGLILDQSQGLVLGPELAANGDFSNGTTGWTVGSGGNAATLSVTAGVLRATSTTTYGRFYPAAPLATVAGRWYRVSFNVISFSSGNSAFFVGTFLNGGDVLPAQAITSAGQKTFAFRAITTTSYLWFENGSTNGGFQEIDNVSVRELPGNHLSQSTATARMLLQTDGTSAYLAADGVDDGYVTSSINLNAASALVLLVCAKKLIDGAERILVEFMQNWFYEGSFGIGAPGNSSAATGYDAKTYIGPSGSGVVYSAGSSSPSAPDSAVLTGVYLRDGVNPSSIIRRNGMQIGASLVQPVPGGTFGNGPLNVGKRGNGTLAFSGCIYSLPMIVKRPLTPEELAAAEKAFGKSIGVLQ